MSGTVDPGTLALTGRLVVGLAGPMPAAAEERWLHRYAPAGVILFRRNIVTADQLRELTRRLHRLLPPGAEIVVDQEGGVVSMAEAAVGRPPAAFTLGTVDDPDLTRAVHAETARRLAACGVDRVLAPVADVLSEPTNPVIGSRAFGRDPERVARHVAAAVAGLREGGVACCLKHWPGHGGTVADPHERAVDPHDASPPETAAVPFQVGLAAGADAVLVGHVPPVPGGRPATLDPATVTAVARLAPGGSVTTWSDDVSMGALRHPLAGLLPPAVRGGEGMLPVGDLPRSWFDAVADGGCHRLPVRSVPWRAFPLPGGERVGPVETAPPLPSPDERSQPPAWRRARQRAAGHPWPGTRGRLLWWEVHPDHRWVLPCPDLPRRAGWRGEVVRWSPTAGEVAPRCDALLVTSVQPLPADGWQAPLRAALAPAGRAVAAGHPALASALRAGLPAAWELTALADAHPWDLAPLWRG